MAKMQPFWWFNKPAVICEQIKNRGFETGDFTNWNYADGVPTIRTDTPHSGIYYAELDYPCYIYQAIDNIPVSDVTTLSFWAKARLSEITDFRIAVFYTDGTATAINGTVPTAWLQCEFKLLLDAGKTINKILIVATRIGSPLGLDDTSLRIC